MSCTFRDRNETILAYVRQELNFTAQEAFEEHYFICAECASDVLFYEKTLLAMQGQGGIVFARPKQRRREFWASLQHLLNRWSGKLDLVWEEGGALRAFAGYALLIIFLGSSSFWLLKNAGSFGPNRQETDAAIAPALVPAPSPAGLTTHLDWPEELKLSEEATVQARLESIRRTYQIDKDYEAAGQALSEVINATAKINDDVKIFLAVCLINQKRRPEAAGILQTLTSSSSSSYRPQAENLLRQLQKE
jgi:hypothetical protein